STITPNYLDNSTYNVAPWCSCAASGNHREQCHHFLDSFQDNVCLKHSIPGAWNQFTRQHDARPRPTQLTPTHSPTETLDPAPALTTARPPALQTIASRPPTLLTPDPTQMCNRSKIVSVCQEDSKDGIP
ncbi:hypothetical protein CRUP_034194, partial [Coryphaenoides rupestris]